MDKKIIKYKSKKNNLEKKIINALNLKKEQYENDIVNSNDNNTIISNVENFFNDLMPNANMKIPNVNNIAVNMKLPNQMFIIVFGSYSVGKTTFITHLENYIEILEKNTFGKTKTNLITKILVKTNIENLKDIKFNLSPQIIIIECDIDCIDKVNLLIQSKNKININIIPKNTSLLKNKFVNKIIHGIKNKSNEFIDFVNLSFIFTNQEKNNISTQIDLLKLKKSIFTYGDFIFLDNIVNLYYNHIVNNQNNYNFLNDLDTSNQIQPFKINNFYL